MNPLIQFNRYHRDREIMISHKVWDLLRQVKDHCIQHFYLIDVSDMNHCTDVSNDWI